MRTFTLTEILAAIPLRPCHVTGQHRPDHHVTHRAHDGAATPGKVCDLMRADAFAGLLVLLGVTEKDLLHELHPDCGWCDGRWSDDEEALAARNVEWLAPRTGAREKVAAEISVSEVEERVEEVRARLAAGRRDAELLDGREFRAELWDAADLALDALAIALGTVHTLQEDVSRMRAFIEMVKSSEPTTGALSALAAEVLEGLSS